MKDKTTHLISIIIIVLFAGSTIWWMKHSYDHDIAAEHYTEHIKDYPLLDPALPFFDKDDLIVNIQPLREYLKSLPEQNQDWAEVSIYFEMMNTGANISINSDSKIWPASLPKLPLAMVAMRKVEKGEWDLEGTKFVLTEEDADFVRTPEIKNLVGQSFDLKFLLERLLLESDNTSYNMLAKNMNPEEIISIGEAVGLERTFIDSTGFSAKEYTRLLRALYLAVYLNEDNSQYLLNLAKNSDFKGFIRAGLPEHVGFAHKWGMNIEQNVYADSGIVYLEGRPFMISVIVKGKSSDHSADQARAEKLITEVGKRSYEFILNK